MVGNIVATKRTSTIGTQEGWIDTAFVVADHDRRNAVSKGWDVSVLLPRRASWEGSQLSRFHFPSQGLWPALVEILCQYHGNARMVASPSAATHLAELMDGHWPNTWIVGVTHNHCGAG